MKPVCSCSELCTSLLPIFEPLTIAEQKMLIAGAQHLNLRKGEFLFRENDHASHLFILRFGQIKLNRYDADGRESVLDIQSERGLISEQEIFLASRYRQNAVALKPSGVCRIAFEDIQRVILEQPEVGIKILQVYSQKLADANARVEILKQNDAKIRLIRYLLWLSQRNSSDSISMTRDDLASTINLRRETISRKLNELAQEGRIILQGHRTIRIVDQAALRRLSCDDE